MKNNGYKTLIAIPCYNESHTIGSVVLKAKKYAKDIVVVDDGSSDDTATVAKYAGAKVIIHEKNKGYGAAIRTCFRFARENNYDVMTILDGDGQHEADQIPVVIKPIIDGRADISIGSRFSNGNGKNIPLYRRFGIGVITRFTNAGSKSSHKVEDSQSGFRSYSKKAIENIKLRDNGMGISAEILLEGRKKNLIFTEMPITCRYDVDGSTNGPVRHGLGVIVSIIKYLEVEHSLLFFGVPGFLLFLSGLILGSKVYFDYQATNILAIGNALITLVLIVVGMLSAMTGLILHAVINANNRKG